LGVLKKTVFLILGSVVVLEEKTKFVVGIAVTGSVTGIAEHTSVAKVKSSSKIMSFMTAIF
jgi:hypothetical protein